MCLSFSQPHHALWRLSLPVYSLLCRFSALRCNHEQNRREEEGLQFISWVTATRSHETMQFERQNYVQDRASQKPGSQGFHSFTRFFIWGAPCCHDRSIGSSQRLVDV